MQVDLIKFRDELNKEILETKDDFSRSSYEMILERVEDIEKLLSVKKYDLVFIGQKGVGKTTAISYLFNLIGEFDRLSKGKKKVVIEELLETGSGGTTICDVVICQSKKENTYFNIVPVEENEVYTTIGNFCYIIWKKVHKKYFKEDDETFYLSSELERAIRNMTGLKTGKEEDRAIKCAEKYEISQFIDFKDEVNNLAKLNTRKKTLFEYSSSKNSVEDEKKWIKAAFRDINLVKFEDSPVPKKLEIFLSKRIFNFDNLPKINSIIDTRGIDSQSNFDRKDIDDYIRKSHDNICVFCDLFPPSPSEAVFNLFKRYLYDDSSLSLASKLLLLVLYRHNEPLNVISFEGKVEDEQEGLDIRKNNIENKLISENVPFNQENILFYNALKHYDKGNITISQEDLDEYDNDIALIQANKNKSIEHDRYTIIDKINSVIEHRENLFKSEIESMYKEFESIKYNFENDDYAKELLLRIQREVEKLKDKDVYINNILVNNFLKKLEVIHTSTMSAINKLYGIYDLNDVFFLGSVVSEELYKNTFKEDKDFIIGKIQAILQLKNISISTTTFFNRLHDKVNKEYDKSIIKLHDDIYHKFKNDVYFKNSSLNFWLTIQNRWGKGSGYRNDVLNEYREHFISHSFYNEVNEFIMEFWKEFLDEVLNIGNVKV